MTAAAPALVHPPNSGDRQTLEEAAKDRVKSRDPGTIPDRCKPAVLVATGDSLTSAHHQTANHLEYCVNTASDPVRPAPMIGNDGTFSYAGKFFDNSRDIVEYYNFARTGFSTKEILVAGPDDVDGCAQKWSRDAFPIDLAKKVVEQAKRNQRAAYFVTTGGINDTNWVEVLSQTLICRALEMTRVEQGRFTWTANNGGGRQAIVPHGGSCIATAAVLGEIHREGIPRFDGRLGSISLRAKRIVDTMLEAGADRVVWMLYYDLNPAKIQIRHIVERQLAQRDPTGFFDIRRLGDGILPVVDPMWEAAARDIRNQLNFAIIKQLPQNLTREQWSRVRIVAPYLAEADIQQTAKGGSPHPSETGHQKMARLLDNAINAHGTGKALRAKVNGKYVAAERGGDLPLIARGSFPGPWETFEFIRVGGTDDRPHVALLSLANHNFVSAEQGGAQPLIANRPTRGGWETFELWRNADDGSISLKSLANNKFVTAQNAGNGPLLAARAEPAPGLGERFFETTSPSGYVLKARVNNKYVTVPNVQGGPLYASEAAHGPVTTFHVLDVKHPELDRNKRYVALMSHTNNMYVSATQGGAQPLMAKVAERPGMWSEELGKIRWEIFEVYSNQDGSISLRALANNKFVTAQDAGNGPLLAARAEPAPDLWEKFDLTPWNEPPQHLSSPPLP